VKRAFLHLAPTGKSSGVADIVYSQANDADRAKNTYNNVELDGKESIEKKHKEACHIYLHLMFNILGRPMRIVFADLPAAVASALPINRRIQHTRPQNTGNTRGGRRGGSSNQRNAGGNPRTRRPKASQADLDADMDSYMAVGMFAPTEKSSSIFYHLN
jgi:THO complex subunit 4